MRKVLTAILRRLLQGYFRFFYRFRLYGKVPEGNLHILIIANHASYFDPLLLGIAFPYDLHFLARESLFRFPLFGSLIRLLYAHPVKQDKSDLAAIKLICSLIKAKKPLALFPEGTRSADGGIGPIKGGCGLIATQTHCDIVPVYIHGSYNAWGRRHLLPQLFGAMSCTVGSPIRWQDFSHLDRKAAQTAITYKIENYLQQLQKWTIEGAKGDVP